ncbi:MAG: non-ribosomal peptide synthetase, partial [Candidatus Aminicenantes bacterium]
RIELGEIENHLLNHNHIKEAVVTAKQDPAGDTTLRAYIVASEEFETAELREYLSGKLPGYMIPAYLVPLDRIPLTPSGKIDRKALPEPVVKPGENYVPPANHIEKKLAEIWSEILGIDQNTIGTNDNFFQLGGHSLKATIMVLKIHNEFNVKIPLGEVFKKPFIRGLSGIIKEVDSNIYASIQPVEKKDYYPVSSAQKRMFILNQLKAGSTSDNTPEMYTVEGDLNKEHLKLVIQLLIERQEILRTSFEEIDGNPVQRLHEEVEFEIEYFGAERKAQSAERKEEGHALYAMRYASTIKNFIRPFDLSQAPLLRLGLVKLSPKKHILMYDMHHIIRDGTSTVVFIDEFINLYQGVKLPGLRIQYKDFTLWQNRLLHSEDIKKQEEYWLGVFSKGEIPVLDLPTDFHRPPVQDFTGDIMEFELDNLQTAKIKELAARTNATLYMVLLSVYTILLSKYSGQEDIVVGTPIAGRPHSDLERMIGMFVNTLAMRNYPRPQKTFTQFLEEVKYNALKAYENQDYQFEELVNRLGIIPDPSRQTLFDTMFVVQNVGFNIKNKNTGKGMKDLILRSYKFKSQVTQFDIMFHAFDRKDKILFKLLYCTKLFKKKTIEMFTRHFKEIISSLVENPAIQLKNIQLSHDLAYAKSTVSQGDFTF